LALAARPRLPARALPGSERMSASRSDAHDGEVLGPEDELRGHGVDQDALGLHVSARPMAAQR
jgi:hypothetical protein